MFAYDTKIFKITKKSPEDQDILQNDLDTLSVWSDKWLLKFHRGKLGKAEKYRVFFTNWRKGIHTTYMPTEEANDLGAVIDGKLVFEQISTLQLIKQVVLWQS